MTVKVLGANRVCDGIAVWLAADGHWDSSLRSAFLARHPEAVAALEVAGSEARCCTELTDINLVEVEELGSDLQPVLLHRRSRFKGDALKQVVRLHAAAN